jgi:serine/threonine protein kinase
LRIHAGLLLNDRFQILEEIGSGGFATVYRVHDLILGRELALKVMRAQSDQPERFRREAMLLAQFCHRNIVKVYSFDQLEDGTPFLTMEFLRGRSLRTLLNERQQLDFELCTNLLIQICAGLCYAHAGGVVHRDLSPANIFLVEEDGNLTVKILDFGLSRLYSAEVGDMHTLTQTGALIGNPNYMSPELARGQVADWRTDIYALGCILYECLSGRAPFEADSAIGLIYLQQSSYPPVLNSPGWAENEQALLLASIALRCLQKQAEKRFQHAEEIVQCLDGQAQVFPAGRAFDGWSGQKQAKSGIRAGHLPALALASLLAIVLSCYCTDPVLNLVLVPVLRTQAISQDAELKLADDLSRYGKTEAALLVLADLEKRYTASHDTARLYGCYFLETELAVKAKDRKKVLALLEKFIETGKQLPNSSNKSKQLVQVWQLVADAGAANFLSASEIFHFQNALFAEMLISGVRDRALLNRCFGAVLKSSDELNRIDDAGIKAYASAIVLYLRNFKGNLLGMEPERLDDLLVLCGERKMLALVDSLFETRIAACKHSGEDAAYLKNRYAHELMGRQPQTALKLCQEAEKETTSKVVIGRACLTQARIYRQRKDDVRALLCYDRALAALAVEGALCIVRSDTLVEKIQLLFQLGKKDKLKTLSENQLKELWAVMESDASVYNRAIGRVAVVSLDSRLEAFQRIFADSLSMLVHTDQIVLALAQLRQFSKESRAHDWPLQPYLARVIKEIGADANLPEELRQAALAVTAGSDRHQGDRR